MTAAEAARRLGAPVRTIQRRAQVRGIGSRHGRALLFSEADLLLLGPGVRGWRKGRPRKLLVISG